jgi:hypothetical protein
MYIAPFNLYVGKADKALQMQLTVTQWDPILLIYMWIDSQQLYNLHAKYMPCLAIHVSEQLFSLIKANKTPNSSRSIDMHLSSIVKVTLAQESKPNICKLSVI